jgi:hypothetical protein
MTFIEPDENFDAFALGFKGGDNLLKWLFNLT